MGYFFFKISVKNYTKLRKILQYLYIQNNKWMIVCLSILNLLK